MNMMKKKLIKISSQEMNEVCHLIGSDVILGLDSTNSILTSKNEIKRFTNFKKIYTLIVKPNFGCSTKDIYSKVRIHKNLKNNDLYKKTSKLKIIENLKYEENSLEKIVISRFPIIQKILFELMITKNCEFSRLTGSGSACFGVFLTKKSADLGLKKIKKKFPKFWCVVGKTI